MKKLLCGIVVPLCAVATLGETCLPGEGKFDVSVWQTTGKRPFREIKTTPFTSHAYTNRTPIAVDKAEVRGRYSWLGVALTDASAWILSQLPHEKIYVSYGGEMKHMPLPYGTWSLTTMVFKHR